MTEDWRQDALCAQIDGDLWFPAKGGSFNAAKRFCDTCPVRQECLEDALALPQEADWYGMRGGVGPRARRKLRAQLGEAA